MSNPLKAMMEETGVRVTGIVNGINEFVSKPTIQNPESKSFWSMDLIVKDHKQAITVKLPDGYNRAAYEQGDIATLNCRVGTFNGKTSFTVIS